MSKVVIYCSCDGTLSIYRVRSIDFIRYLNNLLIATNQRVDAAQRQQRELVAVKIRGSVLFYSSAI